jgi:hypothetical protein
VLLLGAVVLAVLLLVIVLTSAGDDDDTDPVVCFDARLDQFRDQLYAGEVEQLTILVPQDRREFGVFRLKIDYIDGQCANLPQGITGREAADAVIGMVYTFNETSDLKQVEIVHRVVEVPEQDLAPPTPTELPPTATSPPTETPIPPSPTEAPPPPTATPAPASPAVSPEAATPIA